MRTRVSLSIDWFDRCRNPCGNTVTALVYNLCLSSTRTQLDVVKNKIGILQVCAVARWQSVRTCIENVAIRKEGGSIHSFQHRAGNIVYTIRSVVVGQRAAPDRQWLTRTGKSAGICMRPREKWHNPGFSGAGETTQRQLSAEPDCFVPKVADRRNENLQKIFRWPKKVGRV